jgi:hypothetical protein
MTIAPIETTWNGYRFRSRTEARWGVFLTAARIRFEYEAEGVKLASGPYLPDFRLTDLAVWLEIKGAQPTERELSLCQELSAASGDAVLLAVGPPTAEAQITFWNGGVKQPGRYYFAKGHQNPAAIVLTSYDQSWQIGAETDADFGVTPMLRAAYDAARSERFDGKPLRGYGPTPEGLEAARRLRERASTKPPKPPIPREARPSWWDDECEAIYQDSLAAKAEPRE